MKALVFDETNGLRLETDRPVPAPGPGEALLRIRRAGVCATDLEIVKGYVPGFAGVLGHEGVADVVDVGPGLDGTAWIGRRVVPEINQPPAEAVRPPNDAEAAFRNHCANRTVLGIINHDGLFAEYAVARADCLSDVPPTVSDQAAVFVEPLAAAFRILEQGLIPDPAATVAVVGDGRLGLLIAAVLATRAGRTGRVVHIGRHASKLGLIPPQAGTEPHIIPADADGAAWAATAGLAGACDVVVDATGRAAGTALALSLVRPLGTLVLKTTAAPGAPDAPDWAALANRIVVDEIRVVGSRCGPYAPAIAALSDVDHPIRRLVDAMVTATLPLGVEAIETAAAKGAIKVQVVFD